MFLSNSSNWSLSLKKKNILLLGHCTKRPRLGVGQDYSSCQVLFREKKSVRVCHYQSVAFCACQGSGLYRWHFSLIFFSPPHIDHSESFGSCKICSGPFQHVCTTPPKNPIAQTRSPENSNARGGRKFAIFKSIWALLGGGGERGVFAALTGIFSVIAE